MDVKILERDDVILAYIPETLRFFEINGKTKEIIEELNNKSTDEEIIEKWTGFDLFANLPASIAETAETNANWNTFYNF